MKKLSLTESFVTVGAIAGFVFFTVFALLDSAPESIGELLVAAVAGALMGALLLGSVGNWMVVWRRDGFHRVLFRTIGVVLGIMFGYVVALILELGDPTIPRGRWLTAGWSSGIIFAFFGMWIGSLVDRVKRSKVLKVATTMEKRWIDEEIAEVPEDVRLAFERIEKDEYGQPGVFLVAQMKEAKNPFVRAKAIILLAKKRPSNLLNVASEGLSDEDSRVREAAAKALATSSRIRSFSGLPIFKTLILAARDDEDERVRYWIEKCLARL